MPRNKYHPWGSLACFLTFGLFLLSRVLILEVIGDFIRWAKDLTSWCSWCSRSWLKRNVRSKVVPSLVALWINRSVQTSHKGEFWGKTAHFVYQAFRPLKNENSVDWFFWIIQSILQTSLRRCGVTEFRSNSWLSLVKCCLLWMLFVLWLVQKMERCRESIKYSGVCFQKRGKKK